MAGDSGMTDVDMRKAWRVLAGKMALQPGWLASCWPSAEWPALWWRLGLDEAAGLELLVCKPPRLDRWDDDIVQLVDGFHVDPLQLEVELRVAQARALRAVGSSSWRNWWYPSREQSV